MVNEFLYLRKFLVTGAAVIYWGGVLFQARRVGKQIGRTPNLKPQGLKERLLWSGWFFIILGWIGQPWILPSKVSSFFSFLSWRVDPLFIVLGILLLAGGYGGTLWCYAAMGSLWRIGIDRQEKTTLVTNGPYRWIRHPIYLFQMIMLLGSFFLIPTYFSLILLGIHLFCSLNKAIDEERHLLRTLGSEYRDYQSRTGRFLPPI
jgi:protein-S-isoprenylcysteine O-methyltransferase Ste14